MKKVIAYVGACWVVLCMLGMLETTWQYATNNPIWVVISGAYFLSEFVQPSTYLPTLLIPLFFFAIKGTWSFKNKKGLSTEHAETWESIMACWGLWIAITILSALNLKLALASGLVLFTLGWVVVTEVEKKVLEESGLGINYLLAITLCIVIGVPMATNFGWSGAFPVIGAFIGTTILHFLPGREHVALSARYL